jgi:hypothetical protein
MKKEDVLLIVGLNPNTTSKVNEDGSPNRWYIYSTEEIVAKIQQKINEGLYSKLVFVDSSPSMFVFPESKKMNIKVFGKSILSAENEITIIDHEGETIYFNGNQFDFLLPPATTNISVSGVDLVGLLSNTVVDLNSLRYYITLNPTLVKSYKDVTYGKVKGYCKIEK